MTWNQSYVVKFSTTQVNIGSSFSVWCIFNCDDDAIAVTMVAEILGSSFGNFCSFSIFYIVRFKSLWDEAGLFISVDSTEVNFFRSIEWQVKAMILTYPIDGSENSIISRNKVDFQIKISAIDAMI